MSNDDSTDLVQRGSSAPAKSRDDLLASYLAEVRRYPILSPEEEKEVAVRYYEHGDKDARAAGSQIGKNAWATALTYFNGTATS